MGLPCQHGSAVSHVLARYVQQSGSRCKASAAGAAGQKMLDSQIEHQLRKEPAITGCNNWLQVRNHLVSRKPQDPIGSAIECFPAVLQALTARQLELPALAESFVVDLADAVTAVTGAHASADTGLTDFKVVMLTPYWNTLLKGTSQERSVKGYALSRPIIQPATWTCPYICTIWICGSDETELICLQEWLLGVLEAVVQQQEVDHLHRCIIAG